MTCGDVHLTNVLGVLGRQCKGRPWRGGVADGGGADVRAYHWTRSVSWRTVPSPPLSLTAREKLDPVGWISLSALCFTTREHHFKPLASSDQ